MTDHPKTPGQAAWEAYDRREYSPWSTLHLSAQARWEAIAQAAIQASGLVEALLLADRLCVEALPKFDWGRSALDANAIQLLNEAPIAIHAALAKLKGQSNG